MSTATLAPPAATDLEVIAARPTGGQRAWRFVTGLMLIAGMLGSIVAMVFVIHDHVGFSPVLSPSMQPAFGPGDLIVTRSEPATAMKVGQVVALPIPGAPGQRYVHRLISVQFDHGVPVVRTKGDANPLPEPYELHVTSANVPVVVTSIPHLGRVSLITERSTPRLVLIAITLVFGAIAGKRLWAGASRDDENGDIYDD
jgi:signal peptidase I